MVDPTPDARVRTLSLAPIPFPDRDDVMPRVPAPLTSFVGREREVAAVANLVRHPAVRLVTLIGPGGVGKTRLAIAVAGDVMRSFPDGVGFVALASVRDPALVAATVARSLGIPESGTRPTDESIRECLHGRRALLILDNFEHLLGAGPVVADLLAACPDLTVLATSRAVLRISGEHVVAVLPLDLPAPDDGSAAVQPARSEAVRLFAERACAARDDFVLTDANTGAVAEICRRLDGLPLAIELAAARVRHLPPAALLAHLDRRLPLLTGGDRDQPARLQTMRDAIVWGNDLLSSEERTLFRRLSVFDGGFTLTAAAAVAGSRQIRAESSDSAAAISVTTTVEDRSARIVPLEGIRSLVETSLLNQSDGPGDEPRYSMLETIREFALEQLAANDESEEIRRRHGEYFLWFAETEIGSTAAVLLGSDPPLVIARAEAEMDNLRAALVWALARGEMVLMMRLLAALGVFWALGGHMVEARTWFDRALAAGGAAPPRLRAAVLREAAWVARDQGAYADAETFARASFDLFGAMGDSLGQAEALHIDGLQAADRGDLVRARALQERSITILQSLSAPFWTAVTLMELGRVSRLLGEVTIARRYLKEAAALCRATNNRHGEIGVLTELSEIALQRGDHREAAMYLLQRLNQSWDARKLHGTLDRLAGLALARGEHADAARWLGAGERARHRLGIVLPPARRQDIDAKIASARSELDEHDFVTAWNAGQALTPADAAAEAAATLTSLAAPVRAAKRSDTAPLPVLTQREREIVHLVAEGRTDREIAAVLSIGERTVEWHLTNVFNKLGVNTRAAAAAAALRQRLI